MRLSTTYNCVKDVEKSLQFYKFFLQKEPLYQNDNRWIVFDCGNLLALYNRKYDEELIKESHDIHFNQAYIDIFLMKISIKRIILSFLILKLMI